MKESRIIPMSFVENQGRVLARDLIIEAMGKTYVLTVGTQEYMNQLKGAMPPDIKEVGPILLTDNLEDFSELRKNLLERPLSDLMPFLVEQKRESE